LIGLVKLTSKRPLTGTDDEVEEEAEDEPETVVTPRIRVVVKAPAAPAIEEPLMIHLSWAGSQSGPFSRSQIEQMFRSGEIPAEAFYWQDGMEDWRTAEELREPGVA
jgi:hypothetical protein